MGKKRNLLAEVIKLHTLYIVLLQINIWIFQNKFLKIKWFKDNVATKKMAWGIYKVVHTPWLQCKIDVLYWLWLERNIPKLYQWVQTKISDQNFCFQNFWPKNSFHSKWMQNWVIFQYHLSLACVLWQSQFFEIINTRLFLTSFSSLITVVVTYSHFPWRLSYC